MFRRPLVLVSLVLLGSLDVARSLHARHQISELVAAGYAVDRSQRVAAAADVTGDSLYARHCANCHGSQGRGDGPVATALFPRPRDFTGGVFKLKSTVGHAAPTLEDVRLTLRNGMPGTAMPAWGDVLSEAEIDAVADRVLRFGPHDAWSSGESAYRVPEIMGSVTRGRELYASLGCPSCHGSDGHGGGAAAAALRDVWKQAAPPRDLSAPWSFRGGADRESVFRRIAQGIPGTPMPGYLDVASSADIADVVAYIGTIARTPPWEGFDSRSVGHLEPVPRGELLVRIGLCGTCHASPAPDRTGAGIHDAGELAGGRAIDAGAHGLLFASNLTPDPDTGIGRLSTAEISYAIQTGHRRTGRLNFVAMPWVLYGSLSADDAQAIALYLQSLPPVRNVVRSPIRFGFIESVVRKLGYTWPTTLPPRLTIHEVASTFGPVWPYGLELQSAFVWSEIALVILIVLSLFRVPADSAADEPRSSAVLMSSVVASVVAGTAALVVYWYPSLNAVPAKPLVTAFASSVPLDSEAGALLERGRYLFLTSCAFCHNGNGAGGGKLNAPVFGSVWSANLTPHETGLGNWSDAAVLRAMTSGVRRDGRAIDPGSMPWPQLSRLPLVDQQALLAFLRSLPPIEQRVPEPMQPGAADCPSLTFWIGDSSTASGCE